MSNGLGRAAVMLIGIAQWIYAFILSVCVGMANNDESPDLRPRLRGNCGLKGIECRE